MKLLYGLTFIFLLHLCVNSAFAQGSSTGLGLRLSRDGAGFTGKFFTRPNIAFELQLNGGGLYNGQDNSFTAVGLYEYHIPLSDSSWRVVLGMGAHIGTWNRAWKNGNEFILGVDGIAGIEYMFRKAPIGLSVDIKPAVNFISDFDYFPNNVLGLAIRFYL